MPERKLLGEILMEIAGVSEQDVQEMDRPTHGVTLMSDGKGVFEAHSAEAVVDLLNKGQGVFAIALDKVWDDLEGTLATRKAGRAAAGGA